LSAVIRGSFAAGYRIAADAYRSARLFSERRLVSALSLSRSGESLVSEFTDGGRWESRGPSEIPVLQRGKSPSLCLSSALRAIRAGLIINVFSLRDPFIEIGCIGIEFARNVARD